MGAKKDLRNRLENIRNNDNNQEREYLIEDYMPFVIKTITKVTGRYLETENDEELSIGLEAFNESIDKYEFGKGSFMAFSSTIIRNRVIDYLRKENRYSKKIVNISESFERVSEFDLQEKISIKDEIERFKSELELYGISFGDLVKDSPKQTDSTKRIKFLGIKLSKDESIIEYLEEKKRLPNSYLMENYQVTRKIIEKYRKYLISIIIAYSKKFDIIKEYIGG